MTNNNNGGESRRYLHELSEAERKLFLEGLVLGSSGYRRWLELSGVLPSNVSDEYRVNEMFRSMLFSWNAIAKSGIESNRVIPLDEFEKAYELLRSAADTPQNGIN